MVIQNFPGYQLCRIKPNLEPIKRTRTKPCMRGEKLTRMAIGEKSNRKMQPGSDFSGRLRCDVVSWFDDGKNPSQVFLHLINCNAFYRLMCRVHQSKEIRRRDKLVLAQNWSFGLMLVRSKFWTRKLQMTKKVMLPTHSCLCLCQLHSSTHS